MNKRHYEHTLPNIRGSLSNTYDDLFFLPTFFLSFHAPSEFISLFFTAHNKKEGGIEKSFGRQKMLGTAKPSGVIFFGTKGEDRNSFVSIHRNKFAVQKQRLSDGAMKKRTLGEAENKEKGSTEIKEE